MYMTTGEICKMYREAAHQKEMIGILADLNCTDKAEIRKVLTDCGLLQPGTPSRRRGKSYQFDERLAALDGQGLTDAEMAARVGCVPSTVRDWRRRQKEKIDRKRSV